MIAFFSIAHLSVSFTDLIGITLAISNFGNLSFGVAILTGFSILHMYRHLILLSAGMQAIHKKKKNEYFTEHNFWLFLFSSKTAISITKM